MAGVIVHFDRRQLRRHTLRSGVSSLPINVCIRHRTEGSLDKKRMANLGLPSLFVALFTLSNLLASHSSCFQEEIDALDATSVEIYSQNDDARLKLLGSQGDSNAFNVLMDRIFTSNDTKNVVQAISEHHGVMLSDAIAAIVNSKLILRLRFHQMDTYFSKCNSLAAVANYTYRVYSSPVAPISDVHHATNDEHGISEVCSSAASTGKHKGRFLFSSIF